jgi:hypothetical protein
VKGRYGFDYAHHPHRLTTPLIRREGVPKTGDFTMDPARVMDVFREASWEEALDLAGGTLARIRDRTASEALAGFGSAKGSNEEAYLFQKLVRTGFGSNNVDHCTRLCHASSVAALLEGIGSGAVEPRDGRDARRGRDRDRREPDREPPGGRHLDEERGPHRHQAVLSRPAPFRPRAPCAPHLQFKPIPTSRC